MNTTKTENNKIFVVLTLNSIFIGAYSCRQKAQKAFDRLGECDFFGDELVIEEHLLDDFWMFGSPT